MNTRRIVGLVLVAQITLLIAIVGLLGFGPGVRARLALADSVQRYSLLAETMQPIDSTIGYDNTSAFLKTTQASTANSATAYIGQLHLSDGARIVSVRAFGEDTDPLGEFSFQLYRYSLSSTPVWSAVTSLASSGEPFQGGDIELSAQVYRGNAVVDNEQFSYGIYLVLPEAYNPPYQDLGVLRFVVETSYSVQLPVVPRD